MVDVSQASIGRYAAGNRVPRPAILRRIVAASDGAVQANDFFAPRDGPPPEAGGEAGAGPVLDAEVTAIDMLICDMCGIPRGKRLDRSGLAKLYGDGIGMPGSTYALDITGGNVDGLDIGMTDGDPDSMCRPIANTLVPVPWAGAGRVQVLTGMHDAEGRPHFLDPRQVLARVAQRFGELALRPVMAIELEFYLLDAKRDKQGRPRLAASPLSGRRPLDKQVYSLNDLDDTAGVIDAMVAAARVQSIPATVASAEFAPGQFEINCAHQDDPMVAADHGFLLKRAVKGVARAAGLEASFMAKPFAEQSGNGLHIHISLIGDDGHNIFDETRPNGDRRLGHAIAGLQAMMAESMAIFAPNANSYRRLRPDAYAPMTEHWAFDNRTVALRIPPGGGMARRIEHRTAGADANPYLVAAAVLAGVHHGLTHGLDPGPPITGNAYHQFPPTLPGHWLDSLRAFDDAALLPGYLGPEYCRVYSLCKWHEFKVFNARITATEYDWYLRNL
ncbi:MAG: glutamine synthetase [Proteobacteria bacterium]|nr:glutamine synthetase [Pseudomonadota bacterium]